MAERPFFSVLVPVYNAGQWLKPCIESVLGQTDGGFELLLVDDGSTDSSGALCDEYAERDKRIRAFHQENAGQLAARVTALKHHRGEYCVFLDADDRLVPHALETLRKAVDESGADCVVFGIRWDRPGGAEHLTTPPSMCRRLITDRREALLHLLSDDAYNSVCRKCARSSCFDGRDLSAFYHIRSGEDKIQSMEIQENARSFYFLPDELYLYRANEASVTHTICYDDYRADYSVESYTHDVLVRLGIFTEADFDRLRNHLLDALVIELKRICRFCSDRDHAAAALRSIRENDYYRSFLSVGYRGGRGGVKRFLNRIALRLLKRGHLNALIFFCARIYRAG
ncbi:MAG: glycosyltransferase family 2 protein [Eubacteriales bacterium]|nr:glycosyltransferase family 2 protein [Eubacteriales bacterium]